jgi:hypothetical protein
LAPQFYGHWEYVQSWYFVRSDRTRTSSAHSYVAVMQHVEHILVTVIMTPVCKLYVYWVVVTVTVFYKKWQDALVCSFRTTFQQCARLFSSKAIRRACTCNSEQDSVCKWCAYRAVVSTFTRLSILFCWCPPCMRQFVRMFQRTYWCWPCTCCMRQVYRTHGRRPAYVVCLFCWCQLYMHQCVKMSLVHTDVNFTCYTLTSMFHMSVCTFALYADVDG